MTPPERPPSVPAGAVYDAGDGVWQLGTYDEQGERQGTFWTYGADGQLRTKSSYEHGKLEGFWSRFTDGRPGSPELRQCCVPPGARELRIRYREGRMLEEVFFDEAGQPLSDDGTPWPARPPGLPEHACWFPSSGTFIELVDHDVTRTTLRHFTLQGELFLEFDTIDGQKRGRRLYGAGGLCVEATGLDENGKNHGDFSERLLPGQGAYADPRVALVRGQHVHGERAGSWELCGADDRPLTRVEYGDAWGESVSPPVLGSEGGLAEDVEANWHAAEALWERRATRDALATAARALGRYGDPARFGAFLEARAVKLKPESARAYAKAAEDAHASVGSLLAALLGGAEPAAVLATLASSLPNSAPIALDYAEAALLLAPARTGSHVVRALLRIEHGDPQGALDDAALVMQEARPTAEFLMHLARVTYPRFGFVPGEELLVPPDEELVPVEATQPLPAVRHAAAVYATRLALVRGELEKRLGHAPAWLPPSVGELLPDGPVALERRTVEIEDEGENGPELSVVDADATLTLDRSVRQLLGTARGDWAALTWLCWSAGLDRVALPEALVPRAEFPVAAHRATVRCWRVKDRLRSSGLLALARDVPSFDWEGMRIDSVPTQIAEVALAEHIEVRALLFWLLFPQNLSPFQTDLRKV